MNSALIICSLAACIFGAYALNVGELSAFATNYFNNINDFGRSFQSLPIRSVPCMEGIDIYSELQEENEVPSIVTVTIDPRKCDFLPTEEDYVPQYCVVKVYPGLNWSSPLLGVECEDVKLN